MRNKIKLKIGDKFHRLTVISNEYSIKGHLSYLCLCECGNTIEVRGSALLSNNTKACGCLNLEKRKNILLGYQFPMKGSRDDNGKITPEYRTYLLMKRRCYGKNDPKYKNYGGRGIVICERWLDSFENFFLDMGKKPSKEHSIERMDVNGNYEPSNCRWATNEEQACNKTNTVRIIIDGKETYQKAIAKRLGVDAHTIEYHLKKGKSGDEIVSHFQNKHNLRKGGVATC